MSRASRCIHATLGPAAALRPERPPHDRRHRLFGGAGRDRLNGGAADTFAFAFRAGDDTITDRGAGARPHFEGAGFAALGPVAGLSASADAGTRSCTAPSSVTVPGMTPADLALAAAIG